MKSYLGKIALPFFALSAILCLYMAWKLDEISHSKLFTALAIVCLLCVLATLKK